VKRRYRILENQGVYRIKKKVFFWWETLHHPGGPYELESLESAEQVIWKLTKERSSWEIVRDFIV